MKNEADHESYNEIYSENSNDSFCPSENNVVTVKCEESLTMDAEEMDEDDLKYKCTECDISFSKKQNLKRHEKVKHGGKRLACQFCNSMFSTRTNLSNHVYKEHGIADKDNFRNMDYDSAQNPFVCKVCGFVFSKEDKYLQHTSSEIHCNICYTFFNCKRALILHRHNKHGISSDDEPKKKSTKRKLDKSKLICEYCSKSCCSELSYATHVATHTGIRPHGCDQCDKTFAHKITLRQHKKYAHEDVEKYSCIYCRKNCQSKHKLIDHLRTHTKEKPFKCHLCSTSFTIKGNLTFHIKSIHGVYKDVMNEDGSVEKCLVKIRRIRKRERDQS